MHHLVQPVAAAAKSLPWWLVLASWHSGVNCVFNISPSTALCCCPDAADVEWNERYLLRAEGGYVPRFKLETAVLRVPVVPGSDPRIAYGDLSERGGCKQRPAKLPF